jgi:hypothetical protein
MLSLTSLALTGLALYLSGIATFCDLVAATGIQIKFLPCFYRGARLPLPVHTRADLGTAL